MLKRQDRETYEKIDRYLRNQMTDEEAVDFEVKMSLDKDLEKSVKLRRLMIEAIRFKRKRELLKFIQRNSGIRYSGNIWGKNFTRFSAFLIILTGILLLVMEPEDPRYPPEKKDDDVRPPIEEDTLDVSVVPGFNNRFEITGAFLSKN